MSRADKIEQTGLKIVGVIIGVYAFLAIREAVKRKAERDYYEEKHKDEEDPGVEE